MTADNTVPLTRSELIDCRAWIEQHNRPVESWTVREMLEFVAAARSVVPRLCHELTAKAASLSLRGGRQPVTTDNPAPLTPAEVAEYRRLVEKYRTSGNLTYLAREALPRLCADWEAMRAALLVYADKASWDAGVWQGEQDGPDLARAALGLAEPSKEVRA